MPTDYLHLSLADIRAELDSIARDVTSTLGALDERQLNWRPDESRWSVAQCLDHLLATNREMFGAMDRALDPAHPRSVWQRLPFTPALFGRVMIQSLTPTAKRKFPAPPTAHPSTSTIDAAIVRRFIDGQRQAIARVQALEGGGAGRDPDRVIMVSPFAAFITYSVLDAWRIIVAHERRHLAQAQRVVATAGFPA
jgi:hypothetical protein